MLRDFWFPLLLTLAGTVPGIAGTYAEGVTRKWWWTITVIVWSLAALSWIWGDPVRGPFYSLIEQKASDKFTFHAGATVVFPIKALGKGIEFSRVINLGAESPIRLKVSRTWWSGWQYNGSLRVLPTVEIKFTNDTITPIPSGWDFNNDEYAMEIVANAGNDEPEPVFQLIQLLDQDIYVNVKVNMGNDQFMIINGTKLITSSDRNKLARYSFKPIFKYPRYANVGKRR